MTRYSTAAALYRRLGRGPDAGREWFEDALAVVRAIAKERYLFTTDTVRGLVRPGFDLRQIGNVMHAARRAGYCTPTGDLVTSAFQDNRKINVWQSELRE